jgi:hypothetical protein
MDLTAQDRQLMAYDHDLKLFRVGRSKQKRDELQHQLEGDGNDGQEHGFSFRRKAVILRQIDLAHPTR